MGRKKKGGIGAIGVIIVALAVILTVLYFADELQLQELAFVRVGVEGVTVGDLSEQNAIWFGGFIAILYMIGTGLLIKRR